MLIKLGKQIKLPENDNFVSKYGTINALNPQSIFISIQSWAIPRHNLRFKNKIRKLTINTQNKIRNKINYDVFHDKYIVDFDIRESGLRKGKPSFLSIEITLYPKDPFPFPSDIYDSNITTLIKQITNSIKKDRNFIFSAKKTTYERATEREKQRTIRQYK